MCLRVSACVRACVVACLRVHACEYVWRRARLLMCGIFSCIRVTCECMDVSTAKRELVPITADCWEPLFHKRKPRSDTSKPAFICLTEDGHILDLYLHPVLPSRVTAADSCPDLHGRPGDAHHDGNFIVRGSRQDAYFRPRTGPHNTEHYLW